jgi:uroporphyrinogen-III synthase
MKKLFAATLIAVVLASSTAFAFASPQAVQGTVESLDPNGKSVTLVGGETFAVAPNVSTVLLQPGQQVTIMYQDGRDGRKELTAFWIDAGPGSEAS